MLRTIERSTKQKIELMQLPSVEQINNKRIARFKEKITKTLTNEDLDIYIRLVSQYQTEHDVAVEDIAAALAMMAQGDMSLLLKHHKPEHNKPRHSQKDKFERSNSRSRNTKRTGKKSWESKRPNDKKRSADQYNSKDKNADAKPSAKPAKRKYTYRNPALNNSK